MGGKARKIRRLLKRIQGGYCPKCGMGPNKAMEHAAFPSLCPATPSLGGWREPHKDDL